MHDAVVPFHKIGKRVQQIADDLGFVVRDFSITPNLADPDGTTQATAAFELVDPDKKPDVLVIQVEQGMNEAAEAAWREGMERQAAEARKQLEGQMDNKQLRERGKGFL